MPRSYVHIAIKQIDALPDGTFIFTSGRIHRSVDHTALHDREGRQLLISEPFDFLPGHEAAIDVWGELWLGSRSGLLVHNARPLGHGGPRPVHRPPRPERSSGTLTARVVTAQGISIATTAQHHTYLLTRSLLPDGLYRLTGRVSGLAPPLFQVLSSTPLAVPGLERRAAPHR